MAPVQKYGKSAMTETDAIQSRLDALHAEHRALDDAVERLAANVNDQILVQRLKKKKLLLRDHIRRLESSLLPDIIA